eukprot:608157-Hanusia_phi.AAC.2
MDHHGREERDGEEDDEGDSDATVPRSLAPRQVLHQFVLPDLQLIPDVPGPGRHSSCRPRDVFVLLCPRGHSLVFSITK